MNKYHLVYVDLKKIWQYVCMGQIGGYYREFIAGNDDPEYGEYTVPPEKIVYKQDDNRVREAVKIGRQRSLPSLIATLILKCYDGDLDKCRAALDQNKWVK